MARRSTPKRLPALRFQVDGRHALADLVDLHGTSAFIRTAERPPLDRPVVFEWAGAARYALVGRVLSVAEAAPDGRYGIQLELTELTSQEGPEALVDLARRRLDLDPPSPPRAAGAHWSLKLTIEADATPERQAPAMRVAGGITSVPVAALETGRPPTTPELVADMLESLGTKIGMYLNVPCAYWVAGAQYWGRAIRISDRWLQLKTSTVVPGLGVRMRCDVTLDLDGIRRPIAVHGVLGRRQDGPAHGTYKAELWVSMQSIEEGNSPGLLAVWLERTFRERRDGGVEDAE